MSTSLAFINYRCTVLPKMAVQTLSLSVYVCILVLNAHVLSPTWPLHLIGVTQIFWGRNKHLSIGDRRPERNHVEHPVVPNRGVLLRVHHFTCEMSNNVFNLLFIFSYGVTFPLCFSSGVLVLVLVYLVGVCEATRRRWHR